MTPEPDSSVFYHDGDPDDPFTGRPQSPSPRRRLLRLSRMQLHRTSR